MRARHEDRSSSTYDSKASPNPGRPIRQAGPHCGRSSVCGLRRRCLDGAAETVRQCRQLGDLQVLCLAFADRFALRCYFPAHQEGWGLVTLVAQGAGLPKCDWMPPTSICWPRATRLAGEVERLAGTVTVAQCPLAMKSELEVWGTERDALPLMQRIKQKFDPGQVLNPGRFVGGI